MKFLKMILLVLVFLLAGIFVFKDIVVKTAIVNVGSSIAGAPIKVESFSLSFLKQQMRIKNFQLYNPPGFPSEPMVDIPEIGFDYDLQALLKGKLHLPLIIINLKQMVVIRNQDGQLNVDALKVAHPEEKEKPASADEKKEPEKKAEMMPLQIDVLKLNLGKVIYKDYTKGEPPVVQVNEVGITDKTYQNITSPQQLAALILAEATKAAAIKGAKIYAASTLLGMGFLPAGVAGVIFGKDSSTAEFAVSYDKVYDTALALIKEVGELKSEDRSFGTIKAKVSGNDVTLKMEEISKNNIKVTATARKLVLPKPEAAGGILHQLSEKLK